MLKLWHRNHILVRVFFLALLTLILTITWHPVVLGQFDLFAPSPENQSKTVPWWEPNQPRLCGKLWCMDINFPYFPYGWLAQDFTIAARPNLENPTAAKAEINNRAVVIQETMLSIFRKTASNAVFADEFNISLDRQVLKWYYWLPPLENLPTTHKGLHPSTPKIEVGIKNEQTVIFVPAQPELGLSNETIVTVNEADQIHNGKPIEELAQEWQAWIRLEISEALWGHEFNRRYPWARVAIIAVLFIATLIPLIIISLFRGVFRFLDHRFKSKLLEIEESVRSEKIGNVTSNLEVKSSEDGEVNPDAQEQASSETVAEPPSDKPLTAFSRRVLGNSKISNIVLKVQQFLLAKSEKLTQTLPQVSLQSQNIFKQLRNLTQLVLQLLFWLRIFVLLVGLALMATVYHYTRVFAIALLAQAVIIPLIWMLVNLGDKITSFLIDYYLHRWAQEGQLINPKSNRYALRVSTYSPALKGASTFVFVIIGIYATIYFLGIDPAVLAGAGAIALVASFLFRDVFQNMLNGALILWTDRYAIGDVINVASFGGFVENMNLYTTQLRGAEGRLITIPNGQISTVENLTKDWSRVDFKVEIAYDADIKKALEIINEVAAEMQKEPEWQELILEPANILGVDQVTHSGSLIQVWIKTQPMKQWSVGREFRLRIKKAFDRAGIALGVPQQILRRDRVVSNDILDTSEPELS